MNDLTAYIAAIVSLSGAAVSIYQAARQARAEEKQVEVSEDRNAVEGFDALCNQLRQEIARLEAKVKVNDEKIASMERELAAMRDENADLRKQIRLYEAENAGLRAEIRDLRAQLAKYQGQGAGQ